MNLSVHIGSATFPNPVTVASGTFGHSEKYFDLEEVKQLGAVVPKTVTWHPQVGNPPVRIHETPSGMLNAIGIENPGAMEFIKTKLPAFQNIGVPLIISLLGHDDEQFLQLVRAFNQQHNIAAYELNLSCPNLRQKLLVAQDPKATFRLVHKVKMIADVPVIAKLSPNVTDITEIASAAEDAGADAVSLINTFTAMVIDTKHKRSVLGNFTGGLSGPAIRPIALHMTHQVYKKVKIPVVAMGGIMTADDALQFILAGASMVAVGTANFINPRAPLDVLNGIKAYMTENHVGDLGTLLGSVRKDDGEERAYGK